MEIIRIANVIMIFLNKIFQGKIQTELIYNFF